MTDPITKIAVLLVFALVAFGLNLVAGATWLKMATLLPGLAAFLLAGYYVLRLVLA